MYVKVDADGRVTAASVAFHCGDGEMVVEQPDGFVMEAARDWRVVDGGMIFDPLPVEVELPAGEEDADVAALQAEVAELREAMELLLSGVTG